MSWRFPLWYLFPRETVVLISSKVTILTVILKEAVSPEEIEGMESQITGHGIRDH